MSPRLLACFIAAIGATGPGPAGASDSSGLPNAFDAGWQGEKTCELLYETDSVRVGRCIFPPGIGHEKHFHYPHFGYVLEGGTLRITDDQGQDQVRETITGSSWSTTEITVHSALNIGDTTTRYVIVEPKPAAAEMVEPAAE